MSTTLVALHFVHGNANVVWPAVPVGERDQPLRQVIRSASEEFFRDLDAGDALVIQ